MPTVLHFGQKSDWSEFDGFQKNLFFSKVDETDNDFLSRKLPDFGH